MIVAAGAGYGETLEMLCPRVSIWLSTTSVRIWRNRMQSSWPSSPSRRKAVPMTDSLIPSLALSRRFRQQVAGEMFADELIVRDILVEGADQIIAIEPRAFDFVIPVVAEGLGEPHHVHPVARPVLSEMRRGQSRSTSRSYAPGDWSCTNRSTSSGVGGSPVSTKLSLRISVCRSAGSASFRPGLALTQAAMNESTG